MRYSGVGTTSLLEAAVNIADQLGDTALQADALYRLGMVAYDRSESDIAQAHFEEAQPLYEQIGDLLGQANSIYGLGDIAADHSDHDTARTRYEQALVLFHQVREPWSIGWTHRRLARVAESAAERHEHVEAARTAWTSVGRTDPIEKLEEEFGEE